MCLDLSQELLGGLSGVLRESRILSLKVWDSEEPGAWTEDSGFSDLTKEHLWESCFCHSPRTVQVVLTGQPSPLRTQGETALGVRHVCTGRGWESQVRISLYVSLPLPGHTKALATSSPPIQSSPASVLYTEVDF